MPADFETLYLIPDLKRIYATKANSTFHDRIKKGIIPPPDVRLGPRTPAWTAGHIARHQANVLKIGGSK